VSDKRRFRQRVYRILSVLIIIACVWLVILLEEARAAAVAAGSGAESSEGLSETDSVFESEGTPWAGNGTAVDEPIDTINRMSEDGGRADDNGDNNETFELSGEEADNEYAEALLECLRERVPGETGEYPVLDGSLHIIIGRDAFEGGVPEGLMVMYKKAVCLSADAIDKSEAVSENFIIIGSDEYKADGGSGVVAVRYNTVLGTEIVQEDEGQQLWIYLDDYYEADFFVSEEYVYIDLARPRDVHDRIIVVDAGHGGSDPGAVTGGEEYPEKLINLNIVLYLKELLDKDDSITAYYTRVTDIKPSLEERVNMANGLDADLFLSVHCNSSELTTLSGFEVLYNQRQPDELGFNSKAFATLCEEELAARFTHSDRGLVAMAGDVLIVGHSKVPVALLETGYLSNDEDLSILIKEENQRKFAEAAYAAMKRAIEEIERTE